jgi:hypothetical protein
MSKTLRHFLFLVLVATLAPTFGLAQGPAPSMPAASARVAAEAGVSAEVLAKVSNLRGLTIMSPVTNGLKSRESIKAMVLKDLSESTTPQQMRDSTALLKFLGLVPADFELERETVALLTEQIAGFYDPKTKVFYLADWIPVGEQRTVMAHELTHALADQHFNLRRLEKWPDGDGDAELAARALVEGDATAMMIEFELAERGLPHDVSRFPVSLVDLMRESSGASDPEHPVFAGAPAILRESLQFPYVYGAGFVQALLKSGRWTSVSAAYKTFPASTEQVMHPEKFLAGEKPSKIELPEVTALLGDGWRKVDEDVNGEFGYYLILKDRLPDREAAAAAAGWGGDRYAFYLDAAREQATLVHVSTWDTEADATEFFAAYAARCERRFKVTDPGDAAPTVRQWSTPEGVVRLERRGTRVVAIEGFRGNDVGPLAARLAG